MLYFDVYLIVGVLYAYLIVPKYWKLKGAKEEEHVKHTEGRVAEVKQLLEKSGVTGSAVDVCVDILGGNWPRIFYWLDFVAATLFWPGCMGEVLYGCARGFLKNLTKRNRQR